MRKILLILIFASSLQAQFAWRKFHPPEDRTGFVRFSMKLPNGYKKLHLVIPYDISAFSKAYVDIKFRVEACDVPLKMGVSVNGNFLGFFNITSKSRSLKIPISVYYLKKYTTLEVSATPRDLKSYCNGTVEVEDIGINALINCYANPYKIYDYPALFIDRRWNPRGRIYFQIPKVLSEYSTEAISFLAQDLGYRGQDTLPSLEGKTDVNHLRAGVGVIIGTPEEQTFSYSLINIISHTTNLTLRKKNGKRHWVYKYTGKSVPDDKGIIFTVNNIYGYPILIFTGNTPSAVRNAAIFFLYNAENIYASYKVVNPTNLIYERTQRIFGPEPTYFQLSDVYLRNPRIYGEDTRFALRLRFLPGTQFLPYSQVFRLRLKPSPYVDIKRSHLRIRILGQLIFDEPITAACSDTGKEVVIPWKTLRPINYLVFHFQTIPKSPPPDSNEIWVEILGSTKFKMPRKWRVTMPDLKYMKYYAFPFGYSPYRKKTYVILDEINEDKFRMYLEFMRFVGTKDVYPEAPLLAGYSIAKPEKFRKNAVFIGRYTNPKLAMPYIHETILDSATAHLYLAFSGLDGENALIKFFRDKSLVDQIRGSAVTISRNGEVFTVSRDGKKIPWGAKRKFDMRYFFLKYYYKLLYIIPIVLILIFIFLTLLRLIVINTKKLIRKRKTVTETEEETEEEKKEVVQTAILGNGHKKKKKLRPKRRI